MSSTVLGLDLGTSSVKCVLVRGGCVIAQASSALDVCSPQPGWSEQDPSSWITAAQGAVQAVLAQVSDASIGAIALSGQMHGAVVLDADHVPLRPAILWNDNRALDACRALSEACPEVGRIAGVPPLPGFTAPKVMWLKAHEPKLFARIRALVLPKDYLRLWLTGEFATDTSDAAGTLWLDQGARAWSRHITDASGIDAAWLPPLHSGFESAGQLRDQAASMLGLASGTPVFIGGGDAATGALSLGAASGGRAFISLGTSGQLMVIDDAYRPNPAQFVHAYCHTLPDVWFRMAALLNGARPLSWFAGVLGVTVAQMLEQAAHADPARVPLFLPYLTGERSPHGDPDVRAAFYDLQDATTRADMCRAVVEAIAFSMRDAFDSFGSGFGDNLVAHGPIPVIGGGSRSDLVLRNLASVLGRPVGRVSGGEGGAALGAALLAEVGIGARSVSDLSFAPQIVETVEPEDAPELHARLHRFRALYGAVKGGL